MSEVFKLKQMKRIKREHDLLGLIINLSNDSAQLFTSSIVGLEKEKNF